MHSGTGEQGERADSGDYVTKPFNTRELLARGLRRKLEPDPRRPRRRSQQFITSEVERLARLVEDLLALSRLDLSDYAREIFRSENEIATIPLILGGRADESQRFPLIRALDEVTIYEGTLSADEVRAHYRQRGASCTAAGGRDGHLGRFVSVVTHRSESGR